MNEKLFEDDSQWMLFAIVVIMALMGVWDIHNLVLAKGRR